MRRALEPGRSVGHAAARMGTPRRGRGRPSLARKEKRSDNLSIRVKPDFYAALAEAARKGNRDVTDMARWIIGEHLKAGGLLPKDFVF